MIKIEVSTKSASLLLSALLSCLLLFTSPCSISAQNSQEVVLTPEERAYINKLGPVIIGVDPKWEPYEYINSNGEYAGIAADLLKIIAERAGIELRLMPTSSWNETIEKSKKGKCHILTFLNQTPERDSWLLFTEHYFTDYNVFITREEHEYISDPASLINKSIVLPAGTSVEERIRKDFPNLRVIIVESEAEAIKAVNDRKADMTMRSLSMAAYIIKKEGLFNLKIAGTLANYKNMLRIGVLHEHPLLRDILNKSIATLSEYDIHHAINNHISIKVISGTNYRFLIRISILLLILLIIGIIWNRQLRRLNAKLTANERELLQLSNLLKEDISARERIEWELRESEKRLTGIISNLPGFVYSCKNDDDYTMDYVSEGCRVVTGYFPEDFLNNRVTFGSLIVPEERSEIRKKWDRVLAAGVHFEHEYRITNSQGEIRWIWERGFGIFSDSGELLKLEGFISDVTDRKEAEEALKVSERKLISLNNTKDKFFSIIAHDLKSPLSTISGFSDYINQMPLATECCDLKKYTTLIYSASSNALALLENLLEWARVQQGTIPYNPKLLPLRDIAQSAMMPLINNALNKEILLVNQIPEKIDVFCDVNMISTLIRNLINNAIKFTYNKGVVNIESIQLQDEVVVSVSDNGIGIDPDSFERLFCTENNFSSKGTNNEGGTGLGLVLCKEFAERHGGRIWAKSTLGEGSTFFFSLPAKSGNQE
jgi:PAS domain S-box-containing protein